LIVVDASVAVEFLLGRSSAVEAITTELTGALDEALHAPELIEPEVLNALRRLERSGAISVAQADRAVTELDELRLIGVGWENASMDSNWSADAQQILSDLQAKVSARDLPALIELFEEPAVLIGTAGDGRTRAARDAYLEAVTTQTGAVQWDWRETVLFYESDDALGFAAFGDVVTEELRAPIRGTFFAVRANGGWRLRQFHGSIPQSPS
jgi:predicted nucleic acid-binding protein